MNNSLSLAVQGEVQRGMQFGLSKVIAFNYNGVETYVSFNYNSIETLIETDI